MTGETVAAWAFAESRDVWGVEGLGETVVVEEGDDLVVSGRKRFVEAAASADVILVSAMSAAGPTQVLVDADATGLTMLPGQSIDLVRRFADVHLDRVRVPSSAWSARPAAPAGHRAPVPVRAGTASGRDRRGRSTRCTR